MSKSIKVRLLFADDGEYRHEVVDIPASAPKGYDRLIDCLREDESVLKRLYIDVDRLVSASIDDG